MNPVELPAGLELVRTTVEYDEANVPTGLLRAHRVADGVWGRLVVLGGELVFRFERDPSEPRTVRAGEHQCIPPGELHHVEIVGPVRFVVEFHRSPTGPEP